MSIVHDNVCFDASMVAFTTTYHTYASYFDVYNIWRCTEFNTLHSNGPKFVLTHKCKIIVCTNYDSSTVYREFIFYIYRISQK